MDLFKEKIRDIFDSTVESGIKYDGRLDKINYYSLVCKAASSDQMHMVLGNNVCMFQYDFNGFDSILMIFCIPINTEESRLKKLAERVMEILTKTEEYFVTLDYVHSIEVTEDKFVYITIVKKINKE